MTDTSLRQDAATVLECQPGFGGRRDLNAVPDDVWSAARRLAAFVLSMEWCDVPTGDVRTETKVL